MNEVRLRPIEWKKVHDTRWESETRIIGSFHIEKYRWPDEPSEYRLFLNDPDGRAAMFTGQSLAVAEEFAAALLWMKVSAELLC